MGKTLIERLAATPMVGQDYRPYDLSPDGKTIAFQWYRGGDWQIFLQELGGGEPKAACELDDSCCCPLFSPDGRYLYFAKDDRGSECFDFYRCDLAAGTLENLLPDTPDFAPLPDFRLSPDGTHLALVASFDDSYSVGVMPTAVSPGGAAISRLADLPLAEHSPDWSPDGSRIAVAGATRGQDTALYLIDVESGERVVVGGSDEFFAGHPAWSPDGRRIAFCGGPDDHPAIGVYDVETGTVTWAWKGELDGHHPAWAPDGAGLVFLVDHEAETTIRHLDLRDGRTTQLSAGPGNHYWPSFVPDGSAILCAFSGPAEPTDLYRIELAESTVTRITRSKPADLAGHHLKNGVSVRYTSGDRLAAVPALLVEPDRPNGAGVVIIHGGPTWHHSNEWDAVRQAFVAAGLTVLHPNYRGSDGYGRRWQLANRFLMGQGEALDVAGAHAYLVSLGCDPRRIAVTGRSWGGFLTLAMVTQFPGLWAAAVAGVPFFDFMDSQLDPAVRADLRWWDRENTGDIVKDRAKLEFYSPINHLDDIEAPLLLLGGRLDPRCPPRQIGEVAEKLRARGKVCDYRVYEDEGHEISGLANRVDYDRRTVEFILEHTGVA